MSREGLQRVLVVDDEPDILAVIGITLRARGGFEVELCESAGEALEVARRFEPDLILLDVMMPENDGPTILEALRADPKTAVTPVVFLTAKTMPHETARYLDLGAAAVIAKPFDQRTLPDQLREIAGRVPARSSPDAASELATLIDSYAAGLPAKVRAIRELWPRVASGDDAEAVRTLYLRVHSLAGTAATYGFGPVSEVASRLEQVIGDGNPGGAEPASDFRRTAPRLIDDLEAAARTGRAT